MIKIQHLRHASMLLSVSGRTILIDPFLSDQGELPPIPFTFPKLKNPAVPLPLEIEDFINTDAVLITHYHTDHFDETAKNRLPKDTLIFCQPEDKKKLLQDGFCNTREIVTSTEWEGLTISRFHASHGFGLIGKIIGKSSSYTIKDLDKMVFLTGDAVLDKELLENLKKTNPDVVVANAGSAKMAVGRPITLSSGDIGKIAQLLPETTIVAVHMDALNHCQESRAETNRNIAGKNYAKRVIIPEDGEQITID